MDVFSLLGEAGSVLTCVLQRRQLSPSLLTLFTGVLVLQPDTGALDGLQALGITVWNSP